MRCTPACSEQVIAGAAQKEWTTPRPPNNRRQQPVPAIVAVMVSLMHKPWAVAVAAKVPEPGCCCRFGGMPYCPTVSTLVDKLRAGDAVFREEILVSVQTTRSVDEPVKASPAASSPTLELRKYSVPPALRSNELVPGDRRLRSTGSIASAQAVTVSATT